jgi:hypothetical protein
MSLCEIVEVRNLADAVGSISGTGWRWRRLSGSIRNKNQFKAASRLVLLLNWSGFFPPVCSGFDKGEFGELGVKPLATRQNLFPKRLRMERVVDNGCGLLFC